MHSDSRIYNRITLKEMPLLENIEPFNLDFYSLLVQ